MHIPICSAAPTCNAESATHLGEKVVAAGVPFFGCTPELRPSCDLQKAGQLVGRSPSQVDLYAVKSEESAARLAAVGCAAAEMLPARDRRVGFSASLFAGSSQVMIERKRAIHSWLLP